MPLYTKENTVRVQLIAYTHSGALALSPERQSARVSKIKNGALDQYDTEPFEQQQFGTAGVEWVNENTCSCLPKTTVLIAYR